MSALKHSKWMVWMSVVVVSCGAAVAQAATLAPGTVVLSSDWEGLSGTYPGMTWPNINSAVVDDTGPIALKWTPAGNFAAGVQEMEFRAGVNSPFSVTGNVGLVMRGNPANNGPRLWVGGSPEIGDNPNGFTVQFDCKVNDLDGGFCWEFNSSTGNNFKFQVGLGTSGQGVDINGSPVSAVGKFWVTHPTDAHPLVLADIDADAWYRVVFTTSGAWTDPATTYSLTLIKNGGATLTWTDLAFPNPATVFGRASTIKGGQFNAGVLDIGTPGDGQFGEATIDNVLWQINTSVPEPGTMLLMGVGGWLVGWRKPCARS